MRLTLPALVCTLIFLVSCKQNGKDQWVVTQRIQYDVTIKSPNPDFEWWIQNIEGRNRENLVTSLMEAAYSGEVKVYDAYTFQPIIPEQARNIGTRSDTLRIQLAEPPYHYYDTVIRRELSIYDITRIRFLEEWQMDKKSSQISKEVLGLAPLLESYDENGLLRGYQPMFWIFFHKDYPAAMQGRFF